MINVHAKNAQASEGKARLDEMAELKENAPSTSNRKILASMGSLTAFLVYMRSFWSPETAQAQTLDGLDGKINADELEICEIPDVGAWRAEMALALPKKKQTELKDPKALAALEGQETASVNNGHLFLQDGPEVNLPTLSRMAPTKVTPLSFSLDGGAKAHSSSHPFEHAKSQAHGVAAPGGTSGTDDGDEQFPTDPNLVTPPVPEPAPSIPQPGTEPPLDDDVCNGDDDCQPGQGVNNGQVGADDDDCGSDSCADAAQADDCDSFEDSTQAQDDCDTYPVDGCGDDNSPTIALELVEGSLLADFLFGTDAAEEMLGHDGDDRIEGMGGDDAIMGGAGNDDLSGGAGDDLLIGEIGDDLMDGDAGDDLLIGGEGSDHIHGGEGDDRILGGAGDDVLYDGQGRDVLLGGVGDDTIHLTLDSEVDFIDGETGADRLDLSAALVSSRTDIARSEVTLDDGPTDKLSGIEIFVSGSAEDEFDFSGLAASAKPDDAPMFFQITDFGRGDTVRATGEFSLAFDDLSDDALWPSAPDEVSDLEARIRETSGDGADAVPSRLSFRTATEEDMVARVIDFDFDGDGRVDLTVTIQNEPSQDALPFAEQA
ncbi:hypothetical protein KUL25_14005 [Rhodobacteraceae bacterium N5(2021)]|uniref:Uncharacterized protein n=1 Tax=Gymnodinialimonas phycosphaerae TaxID=2841589 RepID=A0A975YEP1_9RHOB|nr:calcium-binding protein [Gymnodinialimonas phycosphaerae]MBY4893879.1 hypothetical protein [Gymnodinialimonas phycosphaerae]